MSVTDNIDVVVLNFDGGEMVKNCIESIRQNSHGINLIVVDQNSKDGSKEWLAESEVAAHTIFNKRNVGVAEGRNQGIRACKYNWVVLVDSDILIQDPNWIDKAWNYTIDRHIGLVEIGVEEEGKRKFGGLSFCLIRRQCFYEVGFFDKKYLIGEDKDWLARFEDSWWKVGYCYDIQATHLGGMTIKTRLANKAEELRAEAHRRLTHKFTPEYLKETLDVYEERRLTKEKELLNE